MKKIAFLILVSIAVCVTIVACNSSSESAAVPETISYNFNVRPILSDKCFACHGPDANKRKAGLRLDKQESAYAALTETKGAFAIVPGKPEQSEMYKRISSTDPSYQMPTPDSHLGVLSETEIAILKKWIAQGGKYERHWAFTAPTKRPLPKVKDEKWVKNEIDNFTLAKMEQKGLKPNAEADRERLLKRVSLDLTGLPPSLQLMDDYAKDNSANAYEKVIDRLLQSNNYGEKMAVHWLDVARYSDSYGYQDDNIRTQWPWRDWLIHAFNDNMPYDKFVTWQLAGDLMPNATPEQVLATGFLRNQKYTEEGGIIPEEYRVQYNLDKTKTYGTGIIGVTIECAQCHDHKYDPFSQKDYYSLYAFFNNSKELGFEGDVSQSKPAKHPLLTITQQQRKDIFTYINDKDTGSLMVSVMGDNDTLRPTHLLKRGVFDAPGDVVPAQAIPAVMKFDTTAFPRNRLGLAEWTVSKNNPLTARVFVNQMWQEVFGRGLVKTTGDFGMQGELPSHPELLDWLAVDFMEHGWNIKRLMKQMLMSATYRQSAEETKEKRDVDPENIYLAHGPRFRQSAETIRDIVLESSGLLVRTIGGPSVKTYQPKGLWEMASSGRGVLATYKQDHGEDLYRRGMYTFIKLTVPPPSMVIFDASNRDQCVVKRLKTNTPLQALIMMNDPTVLEASRVFAQNLTAEKSSDKDKLTKAFRSIICRMPQQKELDVLQAYYTDQLQQFTQKKLDAQATLEIGEYPQNSKLNANTVAALMKTITMMYNLDEAITKT